MSLLDDHFDPLLKLDTSLTTRAVEREQGQRLLTEVCVAFEVANWPRRLGGDASRAQLARDKKLARRVASTLHAALSGWAPPALSGPRAMAKRREQDDIRRVAAVRQWDEWRLAHAEDVLKVMRTVATLAVDLDERRWGNRCLNRLRNEMEGVEWAFRR